MASLDRNLRRDLENAVKKARRVAEAGARQAVEQLAVGHHEPWSALSPDQRKLRNRLRAHGRQLGDKLDEKKGTQSIDRLAGECAYEHWHRLLFARFLAENDLLVEPESGMALSLDECRELAREQSKDWLVLASDFAQRMLPQILEGEPPYDLFVRWKPLRQQPVGWEPDIDDGVRANIRPFMTAKPLNARGKNACILRVAPKIKWDKDRGKEPTREKADFPWFWGWDESTQDFAGGKEFDGNRWNELHYTRAAKLAARERAKGGR